MKKLVFSFKARFSAAVVLILFAGCDKDPVPSPVISKFYPTSGVVGSLVTIWGDQFITTVPPEQGTGPFANTSVVTFNGTVAVTEFVYQDTIGVQRVYAVVPEGATNGQITVTANGITTSSLDEFLVTVPVYLPNVEVTTLSEWGTDIAMDLEGSLFATHSDWHEIIKITGDGISHPFWLSATAESPFGIAADPSGNIFSTVNLVHVLMISPVGEATDLAGGTVHGYADGHGTDARFSNAVGINSDNDGNLYVADMSNFKIRKITPDGNVSTLAGSTFGYKDGAGTDAQFENIIDVAPDGDGNVLVAEDHRIRKITSDGQVTTVAGSVPGYLDGTTATARFNSIRGISVDLAGNLYVSDAGNFAIRRIATDGSVVTLAGGTYGSADGPGSSAGFFGLSGITMDATGALYVSQGRDPIRKVVMQ